MYFPFYSEEEKSQFLNITLEELQAVVEKEYSEKFVKNIQNLTNPLDYPSHIGISRIFLRFELVSDEGLIQEKTITFDLAIGC